VRLWDPGTGEPVGDPLIGQDDQVFDVALSPDGTLLASANFNFVVGDDQPVRLWDPDTGQPVGQPLTGHDRPVSPFSESVQVGGSPLRSMRGRDPASR
jgi:WD40 repeat protein